MVIAPDSSATSTTTTIAIVGSGFSGSLVAAHLLKTATRSLTIKLIESSHDFGKGVAYSTNTPSHLLNVSAGNMSAFPDDPGHLLRWLSYNHSELTSLLPDDINASTFIPRKVYGLYIQSILEEAEASAPGNVRLDYVHDEAIAIEPTERGALITLRSSSIAVDKVVLALGNAPTTPLSEQPEASGPIRNAWSVDALTDLDPDAPVLLIGTGLTMVDMVVSLYERHHRGQIYAISRRGLFPLPHQATKPYAAFLTPDTAPKTALGLLRCIRAEIQAASAQHLDWRAVTDSLRPITQQLWQGLPIPEQQRFLRHARPYWEVHRHRIAPSIGDRIDKMLASDQLIIAAGRIQNYQVLPDGVTVTVRLRKSKADKVLYVSRVINCTGIETDYGRSPQPLIVSLRSQGLIRPNRIGLGMDTAPNGAVVDAQGHASSLLYTLGTPRKGDLWETVAVPELRRQAQSLAETVLQSLPVRVRPVPTIPLASKKLGERSIDRQVLHPTLLFRQLFDPESSSYTYLVADKLTRDAVLVDPVLEQVERDLSILEDLGLTLRYCLETHLHADHITGAGKLRQQTGCRVMVPKDATVKAADHSLADGETLAVGSVLVEAIATPGHTSHHLAYLINGTHLLTGDALLIRGCGRTDFQGGDAGTLYDMVTQRLFALPDDTLVYPGHDYKGHTVSTIGEEKQLNPRFAHRSRNQFIILMAHLGLSYPQKMKEAVPANEYCGDYIPQNGTNLPPDETQQESESMLSANAEIYNSYFAMYI
ncbi:MULTISPECIES: FAD/NAD(P)-binding protein [unclassified Leptolyngbya]|uniref:FAD/NAD(P)-binding protein n=1 Tax=unclassified Leptolyngbya TaxID=2650499 RepID=UPI001682D643|nr:FAD/NAD(P)-binding protein [Leptolyngbya sp. FACHB-8]MBD2158621.1 FAD/NAD(P)-binding protein [Leptolyngbya sp. FACHB-16]